MVVGGKGTGLDIYVLRIVGDSVGKPIPVLTTEANEYHPSFSPDGKWLAYASDRTGRAEVYVQAFPNGGTPQRISLDGGDAPVWNRAGHELFYRNGVQLMSVSVAGGKTALEFGKPQKLFQLPFTIERLSSDYDVSPDGKWFVVQTQLAIPPRRLDVMLNWVP
jgi:Tol biopolymer transport system component